MTNKESIIVTKPVDISNLIRILELHTILFREARRECLQVGILNHFTPSRIELESIDEKVDPFIKNIEANPAECDINEIIDLINRIVSFTYSMRYQLSHEMETKLLKRVGTITLMDKVGKRLIIFQFIAILFSSIAIFIKMKEYFYS